MARCSGARPPGEGGRGVAFRVGCVADPPRKVVALDAEGVGEEPVAEHQLRGTEGLGASRGLREELDALYDASLAREVHPGKHAQPDELDSGGGLFLGIIADIKRRKFEIFDKLALSDEAPIRPERVISTLMKVLPADATVVSDPGTSCPYFSAYYQLPQAGRHFITNRAHGALGYSLSASLGAWYGRPASKTVALMGDGSFGFTVGELETVCRARAPITFVVFSNASFGWIKASQQADKDARYYNVDFGRTDQAAIAAAYGVKSWRVEDPADLDRVLAQAVAHNGPSLVDVICQPLEDTAAPVRRWMG